MVHITYQGVSAHVSVLICNLFRKAVIAPNLSFDEMRPHKVVNTSPLCGVAGSVSDLALCLIMSDVGVCSCLKRAAAHSIKP